MSQRVRTILAATLLSAACASATPIANPYSGATSSELSTWAAALSGSYTTLNFGSLTGTETSPWTLGGFTFSGFNDVKNQEFQGSSITVTPPTGETAIFLFIEDLTNYGDSASSFTLMLSDGETSGPVSISGSCIGSKPCWWYGFTDSTPITSLVISANSGTLSLGELYYGTAEQAAPQTAEVATFFLAGGGLLLLFAAGRKLNQIRTA